MPTVSCHNCRKRYRLRDGAPLPPCPHCGSPLTADEPPPNQPLRAKLQAEMERIAAARSASAPGASAPRVRIAPRPRRSLLPLYLLIGAAVVALALCGAGWALWSRTHAPAAEEAQKLKAQVQAAISEAQQADAVGRGASALTAWQIARRQVLLYQRRPQDFQTELSFIERRIGELEGVQSAPAPPVAQAGGEAGPAPPQPASPEGPAAQPAATTTPAAAVVLDAPGADQRWQAEPWADPVTLKLDKPAGDADEFVALQQADGKAGKWVVSLSQPLDLTPYDALALDVRNDEPVSLSVAFATQPGPAVFETQTQSLEKGDHRGVAFALKGNQFKSDLTNWQFGTDIKNPAGAVKLSIFIYTRSQAPIRFRNVCLLKGAVR